MKKLTLSVAALTIAMMSYGQSTQCKRTNVYKQCENRTTAKSKLCYLHNPNYVKPSKTVTVICSGITKVGDKCKNKTKHESGLCHNHRPKKD